MNRLNLEEMHDGHGDVETKAWLDKFSTPPGVFDQACWAQAQPLKHLCIARLQLTQAIHQVEVALQDLREDESTTNGQSNQTGRRQNDDDNELSSGNIHSDNDNRQVSWFMFSLNLQKWLMSILFQHLEAVDRTSMVPTLVMLNREATVTLET